MSIVATLFIAGAVAVKCHKRIEECYALCAIALSIILYLPGLYVSFTPGIVLCYVLSACSIFYLGLNFFWRRDLVKESVLTSGLLFLLACIAFFAIYGQGRGIDHSDDFYFWDLRIKNFLYYGKIKGIPNTALGDHPPMISVWDYLAGITWMRTASHGIFLWAQNVLLISFLAPALTCIKGKYRWIQTMISSFILFLIPTMIGDAYHTLLTDLMLGAIMFYCFYAFLQQIRSADRFYTISLIIGMITLTMTKRTGAVFTVIVLFTCAWMYRGEDKKVRRILLFAAICSAGFIWSWSGLSQPFYVLIGGTAGTVVSKAAFHMAEDRNWYQKHGKSVIGLILLIAFGGVGTFLLCHYADGREYLQYVIQNLCDTERMNPSFIEMFLVSLVMLGIVLAKEAGKAQEIRTEISIKRAGMAYLFCFVGYFFLIWYLMITTIGPANEGFRGLNIRYFIPLLIPLGGCILLLVNNCADQRFVCVSLFIMAVIIRAYSDKQTIQNIIYKTPEREFYEFSKNNIILTPEDRVYFVDENDDYPYEDRAFYNYIFPAKSQFGQNNFLANLAGAEMTQSVEEWTSELETGGYNYVYVQLITEESAIRYQSLFESENEIGNGRLYQVLSTDDGIKLIWLKHD